MNKQDLKFYAKQNITRLQNSVLRAISAFPQDSNWDERHVRVAIYKLVENPELSTEKVIKAIKIADAALTGKSWNDEFSQEYNFQNEVHK